MGGTVTDVMYTYAWQAIAWSDRLRGRYVDSEYTRRLLAATAMRLVEQQFIELASACPDTVWEIMTGRIESPCCDPAELIKSATEAAWGRVDDLDIRAAQALAVLQVNRETSRSPCLVFDTALTSAYLHLYERVDRALRQAPPLRPTLPRRPDVNLHRTPASQAPKVRRVQERHRRGRDWRRECQRCY